MIHIYEEEFEHDNVRGCKGWNYEQMGILKQNLQNVWELRLALCMTEFTVQNLSFQDNYVDTEMYPFQMVL